MIDTEVPSPQKHLEQQNFRGRTVANCEGALSRAQFHCFMLLSGFISFDVDWFWRLWLRFFMFFRGFGFGFLFFFQCLFLLQIRSSEKTSSSSRFTSIEA